jgi:hypothetical protein
MIRKKIVEKDSRTDKKKKLQKLRAIRPTGRRKQYLELPEPQQPQQAETNLLPLIQQMFQHQQKMLEQMQQFIVTQNQKNQTLDQRLADLSLKDKDPYAL